MSHVCVLHFIKFNFNCLYVTILRLNYHGLIVLDILKKIFFNVISYDTKISFDANSNTQLLANSVQNSISLVV